MKHMVNFKDFEKSDLYSILELAMDMKRNPSKYSETLQDKKLYTLFEKTSTRTFLSFATGITELGGTYYNQLWKDSNFVLGDLKSEIKYIGRNVDIIMARLISFDKVELFEKYSTVPFINGCDSTFHPCQILADALTLNEQFGTLNIKMLYIGAKNNVFNSLVEFFAIMGEGTLYGLTPLDNHTAVDDAFYADAKETGHYVELNPSVSMEEVKTYVKDMDVLYTDTWVDMEFFNNPDYAEKKEETIKKMKPYQINEILLEGSKAKVMHDMPMHIGYEISQKVVDQHLDLILDQAENRRHAEKAIMAFLLKD